MAASNGLTNLEENRFWLLILGDKASILVYRLGPEHATEITQSKQFSSRFYELAKQARENLPEEQLNQLNQNALYITQEFKQFVSEILRKQLFEKFNIGLVPTFVNNIINMANMYLYILGEFIQKRKPNFQPLYYLGFWLPIITPDTIQIENNVGLYFYEFKEKTQYYTKAFLNDEIRIREGLSVLENGIPVSPVVVQVISEIYDRLSSYGSFVVDTLVLVQQKKLPSSLNEIFLDHHYRIVCYVVTELSFMLGKKRPICDPGSPTLTDRYTIT